MVIKEDQEFTSEDWAQELASYYPVTAERKPGGITVTEAAELWNVGERTAGMRLIEMLEDGILTREWTRCGNRNRFVYYKT